MFKSVCIISSNCLFSLTNSAEITKGNQQHLESWNWLLRVSLVVIWLSKTLFFPSLDLKIDSLAKCFNQSVNTHYRVQYWGTAQYMYQFSLFGYLFMLYWFQHYSILQAEILHFTSSLRHICLKLDALILGQCADTAGFFSLHQKCKNQLHFHLETYLWL